MYPESITLTSDEIMEMPLMHEGQAILLLLQQKGGPVSGMIWFEMMPCVEEVTRVSRFDDRTETFKFKYKKESEK